MTQYKGDLYKSGENLYDSSGSHIGRVTGQGRGEYINSGEDMGYISYSDLVEKKQCGAESTSYDPFDGNGTPTPEEFYGDGNYFTGPLKFIGYLCLVGGLIVGTDAGIITGVAMAVTFFFMSKATIKKD